MRFYVRNCATGFYACIVMPNGVELFRSRDLRTRKQAWEYVDRVRFSAAAAEQRCEWGAERPSSVPFRPVPQLRIV